MEPTQSANNTPTNEAGQNQNKKATKPSGADNQGMSSHGSEAGQRPADGKSWMEYANLQKVVDQLPQGVRDFCSSSWDQVGKSLGQVGNQVNKLNTTQKVAGAVALAGIGYLALRSGKQEKQSGMGSMYRGDSSKGGKKSQPSYRSGGYSSASYNSFSSSDASSSFDRQNESRAGGSYQSGSASQSSTPSASTSAKPSSDYSSGSNSASNSSSSSMSGRSMGYRGSASTASSSEELDLGAGV